jgi:hypothetical protein
VKPTARRDKKTRINFKSDCFSLSNAKTYLGRLVEKARKGETVFIVQGQRRFILQEVKSIDPIPMRPAGYFSDNFTAEDIKEFNETAKSSIARAPNDLE